MKTGVHVRMRKEEEREREKSEAEEKNSRQSTFVKTERRSGRHITYLNALCAPGEVRQWTPCQV